MPTQPADGKRVASESPKAKRPKAELLPANGNNGCDRCMSQEDSMYFDSYASMQVHITMLSDTVRTVAYRRALLLCQSPPLTGQVGIDVGSGSGILSNFACEAGAKRVIAIEASASAAAVTEQLLASNGHSRIATVMNSSVEQLVQQQLQLRADFIVSEWMGYCLLHETMLQSVLLARDCWLKPQGLLFPNNAAVRVAAAAGIGEEGEEEGEEEEREEASRLAALGRVYGCDLSAVSAAARAQRRRVATVATLGDTGLLLSDWAEPISLQLEQLSLEQLRASGVSGEFSLGVIQSGTVRCLCLWFRVGFPGSDTFIDTSPMSEPTHWQQTFVWLPRPLAVEIRHRLVGSVRLSANHRRKRCLDIHVQISKVFREGEGEGDGDGEGEGELIDQMQFCATLDGAD